MIFGLKSKAALFGALFILLSLVRVSSGLGDLKERRESCAKPAIAILVYHRFGAVASDSMSVTTDQFESHVRYLMEANYTIVPLRHLVEYHLGKRQLFPGRFVAITVDDGHKSVYTNLFPLVRRYQLPVTLFLYPSAISNASYAMTWDQLRELKASGFFDFQGHTYWHPNFKIERKRRTPLEYEKFVELQLKRSKEKLEKELEIKVDMLSWPFGIYDENLIRKAMELGYCSAFTIERHPVRPSDSVMALPRYLITDSDRGKAFERLLGGSPCS